MTIWTVDGSFENKAQATFGIKYEEGEFTPPPDDEYLRKHGIEVAADTSAKPMLPEYQTETSGDTPRWWKEWRKSDNIEDRRHLPEEYEEDTKSVLEKMSKEDFDEMFRKLDELLQDSGHKGISKRAKPSSFEEVYDEATGEVINYLPKGWQDRLTARFRKNQEAYKILDQGLEELDTLSRELDFQTEIRKTDWWKEYVRDYGEEPDLDTEDYNYRAAWKSGARPDVRDEKDGKLHWPSEFKGENHPNRYVNGVDTITGKPVEPQYMMRKPDRPILEGGGGRGGSSGIKKEAPNYSREATELHLNDVVSKWAQGKATAKDVQNEFKSRGWSVDLRKGRYDVEAFDPDGKQVFIQP